MSDLRKAAEMALGALETLWDILDDIDTASDMAKENDAWYRKRVEALQKKRWDTMITTDGYKLKDGPVEALHQALAQHVDAVNMSQECVDETAKHKREWVGITEDDVHHAFNYVEMVKCLDFDRDRQAWCENFAAHIEATLRQQNGFGWASK